MRAMDRIYCRYKYLKKKLVIQHMRIITMNNFQPTGRIPQQLLSNPFKLILIICGMRAPNNNSQLEVGPNKHTII